MQRPVQSVLPLFLLLRTGCFNAELPLINSACPSKPPVRMVSHDRFCFAFNDHRLSWFDAKNSCQQNSGRLAMISDALRKAWLRKEAAAQWPSQNLVWIGQSSMPVDGGFKPAGQRQSARHHSPRKCSALAIQSGIVQQAPVSSAEEPITDLCSQKNSFICEYVASLEKDAEVREAQNAGLKKEAGKGYAIYISVAGGAVVLVIIAVFVGVLLYRRKRKLSRPTLTCMQGNFASHAVSCSIYATDLSSSRQALVHNQEMEPSPNSGFAISNEWPEIHSGEHVGRSNDGDRTATARNSAAYQ